MDDSFSALEEQRLRALHQLNVLDTPPEEEFDRVTRLAGRMFDVPVALITLVDSERQWFKSCYGFDHLGQRETPRNIAFCNRTIEQKKPLIVPDATLDVRFADNPDVIGAKHVRFYAGASLYTRDGWALGTLCLIDFVPRSFDAAQEKLLVDLAEIVSAKLDARRDAQEALGFERRLRTLLASTSDIISLLDAQGVIRYKSEAVTRVLGYVPAELIGQSVFEFVHPDDQPMAKKAFGHLVSGAEENSEKTFTVRYFHANGEVRVLEMVGNNRLNDPDICALVITSRDVTERHRVEEALLHNEALFKGAFDLSATGMALVGLDGAWLRVNRQLCEMLGYTPEELMRGRFQDVTHPDDLAADLALLHQLVRGEIPFYEMEKRYFRKDGGIVWVSLYVSLVRNAHNEPLHFISHIQDITQRKQTQADLFANQARKSAILETSLDGIITIDHEGKVVEWNPAAADILKFSRDEAMGRALHDLVVPPEYQAAHQAGMKRYIETGIGPVLGQRIELPAIRADGEHILVELAIVPVPGTNPPLFTGHMRDITERKQAEIALQNAKDEAERANHAKNEFLSRMSHELRTPLNAVLGFGQLLELSDLASEDRQSVTQILKGGNHLLELINEVLDISRIESGNLSISSEPVNLGTVAAEALDLLRPLAREKNIQLRSEFSSSQIDARPCFVVADQQRLKQVVLNLLSNAIKYNREDGWVSVGCEAGPKSDEAETTGETKAPTHWRLWVRDSGWGLSPEKLARLFTPFDRLGVEGTGVEGTGIGLSLSQRLVELMGGTLSAQSLEGEGCTFWIELPMVENPLERAIGELPSVSGPISTRWLILNIEDNLSNLHLLQRVLAHRPEIKIISAIHGALGLELARQHCPDLILLDLHLPEMPGEEVLHRLQSEPGTQQIPVVVLSADSTTGRTERLLNSGAYAFVPKPFNIKHLIRVINSVLQPSAENAMEANESRV